MFELGILAGLAALAGIGFAVERLERRAKGGEMAAYRCTTCGTDWPAEALYRKCPGCETNTAYIHGAEPVDGETALWAWKCARFDRYCAARDKQQMDAESRRLAGLPESATCND